MSGEEVHPSVVQLRVGGSRLLRRVVNWGRVRLKLSWSVTLTWRSTRPLAGRAVAAEMRAAAATRNFMMGEEGEGASEG